MRPEDKYLQMAEAIGLKLCRDAIWYEGSCNWISAINDPADISQTIYATLNADLYEGSAGVALFLARLYKQVPDPIVRTTVYGACRNIEKFLEKNKNNIRPAFYIGSSGMGYTLVLCGEILKEQTFIDHGLQVLRDAGAKRIKDTDIISGAAGLIPVWLSTYNKYKETVFLDHAKKSGDLLCEQAEKKENGWSWQTLPAFTKHLTGFAHGSAGISSSLFELYHATQEDKYLQAAKKGFQYEDGYFNEDNNNWPDFRNYRKGDEKTVSYSVAWCHGAPGIGLSRIRAFEITGEVRYQTMAHCAITSTLQFTDIGLSNGSYNLSLCHGICGNLDLLIESSRISGDVSMLEQARKISGDIIAKHLENDLPFPSGLHGNREAVGLLLGIAGVGYHCLRLADPFNIPSVLISSTK